jgi:Ca2+-binding RTX toxin-like protein
MSKRTPKSFRPEVVELESREVPSIASVQLVNHILTVKCGNAASTVVVTQAPGIVQVQDLGTGKVFNFGISQVSRVDVFGGSGNDTLTSRGANEGVRVRLNGGGGNNTLYGGPGREILVGGDGNNTIYGRSGSNDVLMAGNGNNLIVGCKGDNVIQAGNGTNTLIGGAGINAITGGSGNNTIVSINNATNDTVDPGSGSDVLWIDGTGTKTDRVIGLTSQDVVHVTAFANGASKHLNGRVIWSG